MNRTSSVVSIIALFFVFTLMAIQPCYAEEGTNMSAKPANKKILVAYFSHTGNTREIADQIHKIVGGDIFEIQTVVPYTKDYNALTKQAKKELDSGYKPELRTNVQDIGSYDVIFIGSPNWWSSIAPPVITFLSSNNFEGKTIIPFITHGGGGKGHCFTDVEQLCPTTSVENGYAFLGSGARNAQREVSEWLKGIKSLK